MAGTRGQERLRGQRGIATRDQSRFSPAAASCFRARLSTDSLRQRTSSARDVTHTCVCSAADRMSQACKGIRMAFYFRTRKRERDELAMRKECKSAVDLHPDSSSKWNPLINDAETRERREAEVRA